MSTVKSPITKNVPVALTAAYTNSTGGNAILKAVNVTGNNDPTNWSTATTGATQEWSFFGTNLTAFAPPSLSYAHGAPLPIRISADKALLIWAPNHMHVGGQQDFLSGTVVHTQVVQWNGTAYVSGPIVNLTLPTAIFTASSTTPWDTPNNLTGSYGQTHIKGLALTSSKIAIAYRYGTAFRLMRVTLNASGTAIDPTTYTNLDLTTAGLFNSTTAYSFDLAAVPDDTTKVLVGGTGATNYMIGAFSVPDTGSIASSGSITSTGIANSTYGFTIAQLNKTAVSNVTTYTVAGTTSSTAFTIQNVSFNSTNNTFGLVGAAQTGVTPSSTIQGLMAACLSTDGTANAVIATVATSNVITFYRQTSLTAAASTATTLTLQSSVTRGIKAVYSWGTSKVVFQGDAMLAMYDNTGTATNLLPATQTTDTTNVLTQWLPFDSRPLFTFFDPNTVQQLRAAQYYSFVGAGALTTGTLTTTGNYFPWGHNYGGHYAWSDAAQCYFVGFGSRIYALDIAGNVLSEVALPQINTLFTYMMLIKQLTVTPSGKIVFVTDNIGASTSYLMYSNWSGTTAYSGGTVPVTAATDLPKVTLLAAPVALPYHQVADLVSYTDFAGVERAIAIFGYNSTNGYYAWGRFDGSQWIAGGNVGVTSVAINAWNIGGRPNVRLFQAYPCDAVNPTGLWGLVGGTPNTAAASCRAYISTTFYNESAFASLGMTQLVANAAMTYSATRQTNSYTGTVAFYDTAASVVRMYNTIGGRQVQHPVYGWSTPVNTGLQYINIAASKYVITIAPCNTGSAGVVPNAYVFDTATTTSTTPKFTLAGNSTASWINLLQTNQGSVQVYTNLGTVNNTYSCGGTDTTKFTITINNGTSDFYVTPVAGQTMRSDSTYRATDTYLIPNGFSVKVKSTVPNAVDAMFTIVEEA